MPKEAEFEIEEILLEPFIKVGNYYIKPSETKSGALNIVVWERGKTPREHGASEINIFVKGGKDMQIESW